MSRKILFFVNPISGTGNKRDLEKKIIATCTAENLSFKILYTSADGDYRFLRPYVAEEEFTDVVICGGDGSLRPIISELLNSQIRIGIIPAGSGNGLARSAGIPQKTGKALEVIFRQNASPVDAILINNQLSCHLSGLGFDATVAHDFARKKKRGLSTYIGRVLKNFLSLQHYDFEIGIDDERLSEKAFCIVISNSNQFGNNFKIAPKASICDGLLDVIVFKKTGRPGAVISVAMQLFTGKIAGIRSASLAKKKVLYFQTKKVTVKNPERAPLHIDGDPVDTSAELSVEILPAAYLLLQ